MKRHSRGDFFVVGEGILFPTPQGLPGIERPSTEAELRKFRFSRLGPKGATTPETLRIVLANAMVTNGTQLDAGDIPAGYTYLGQFIDHDLTLDKTSLKESSMVNVSSLLSGRSPALDLDSVYGMGPDDPDSKEFYKDGIRFKLGRTAATTFPDGSTNVDMDGFDLPRSGFGSKKVDRRKAVIGDHRNDENLIVAQTHLAMMRFHNRVVDTLAQGGTPSALLFERARESVVKHYQWMLKTDYLTRVVEQSIVDDVFTNGRKVFEPQPKPGDTPTMPLEFSVGAFRLGHSQIRGGYAWNRVFRGGGPGPGASLGLLFQFSGTSGTLSPDGDPPAGTGKPEVSSACRQTGSLISADFTTSRKKVFQYSKFLSIWLAITSPRKSIRCWSIRWARYRPARLATSHSGFRSKPTSPFAISRAPAASNSRAASKW